MLIRTGLLSRLGTQIHAFVESLRVVIWLLIGSPLGELAILGHLSAKLV